jgi:hypothetical protein
LRGSRAYRRRLRRAKKAGSGAMPEPAVGAQINSSQ